jgi:hypothetical protein
MGLSKQLAYTAGALFIEIDDADNARYATYKDYEATFQIELQNVKSWTTLFDFIAQTCFDEICGQKATIESLHKKVVRRHRQLNDESPSDLIDNFTVPNSFITFANSCKVKDRTDNTPANAPYPTSPPTTPSPNVYGIS